MAKARFLHETNVIADQAAQEHVSQTSRALEGSSFPVNIHMHVIFCVLAHQCRAIDQYLVEAADIVFRPQLPSPSQGWPFYTVLVCHC